MAVPGLSDWLSVTTLAAVGVVTLAACVQGSIGFGLALVAAPALGLLDSAFVPAPLIVASVLLSLLIMRRERRAIDVRGVGWVLGGSVVGTSAAALVLRTAGPRGFSVLLGSLVLAAVIVSALGIRLRVTRVNSVCAGALSGFMGTASSIAGPPVALLYQHERGAALRGNLAAYFFASALLALTALRFIGRFGMPEVRRSIALLLGVALGFALSSRFVGRLDARGARPFVLMTAGVAGLMLLARALFSVP